MTPLEFWAYLWIALLAITNVIQFFVHWYAHHRGTVYESKDANKEEP